MGATTSAIGVCKKALRARFCELSPPSLWIGAERSGARFFQWSGAPTHKVGGLFHWISTATQWIRDFFCWVAARIQWVGSFFCWVRCFFYQEKSAIQ